VAELGELEELRVFAPSFSSFLKATRTFRDERGIVLRALEIADRERGDVLEEAQIVLPVIELEPRPADHRRDRREEIGMPQREIPREMPAAADARREDAIRVDVDDPPHPTDGRESLVALALRVV
jgi:hypothetical protein